jgi:hypothetical protein
MKKTKSEFPMDKPQAMKEEYQDVDEQETIVDRRCDQQNLFSA